MSWIACCVPRAVWHTPLLQMSVRGGPPAGSSTTPRVRYTCILQMSEATVPVNNLVTLWEWRGASAPQRPSQHLRDTLHLWHRCGTAVAYHRCGTTMAPPRRTPRPGATGAHDRPSYTLLRWLLPASKAANYPDPMVREGTLVSQAAARRVAADAAPPHRILPRACSAGRGVAKERGSVKRTKGGLASRCRSTASGAA